MSPRRSTYAEELEALLLILRTVYVVGQPAGQRGPDAMLWLMKVDPDSAEKVLAQYGQIT
ncbi:hypothetical protein [Actinoallomurus sp. CA-150999]|uniref:hypothetical protein n=1 Tax=Actinoallomurus sp. CA-150999 TaxID=3239887 RepID=UPI003D8C9B50